MPFITGEARRMTDTIGPREVGDHCFLHYREMLRKWRHTPRWRTAHEIYKDLLLGCQGKSLADDDVIAKHLAWQVFFHGVVMPYEDLKRVENGQVDF